MHNNNVVIVGVTGVGGTIMSLGGTIELLFDWGLSYASNNIIEAYALLQGLRLSIECNIQSLIAVDDLNIAINKMV